MIVRCDKCSTRFRLDDSKVTDAGVRVRCSKCRNIFTVYAEPHEEPDVDALFQGMQPGAAAGAAAASAEPPVPESPQSQPESEFPQQQFEDASAGETDGFADAWGETSFSEDVQREVPDKNEAVPEEEEDQFSPSFDIPEDRVSISPAGGTTEPAPEDGTQWGSAFVFDEPEASPGAPQEEFAGWQEDSAPPMEVPPPDDFSFNDANFDPLSEEPPAAQEPAEEPTPVTWQAMPEDEKVSLPEEDEFLFEDAVRRHDEEHFETPDLEFHFEEEEDAAGTAAAPAEGKEDSVFVFEDEPALTPPPEMPAPKLDLFAEHDVAEEEIPSAAPAEAEPQRREATPAYDEFLAATPPPESYEEELPPLSISSRRQGNPFAMMTTVVAVIAVVALGIAGVFYFGNPSELLSSVGLDSVAKKFGASGEEGSLQMRGVQATYVHNAAGGDLFVVKGEVVNGFPKPRAAVQVRVKVLGPKGEILQQRVGYCGNQLSQEQLATLPLPQLESAMNAAPAAVTVQPGKSLPCVVAVAAVSAAATDFAVEAAGSTPAAK